MVDNVANIQIIVQEIFKIEVILVLKVVLTKRNSEKVLTFSLVIDLRFVFLVLTSQNFDLP